MAEITADMVKRLREATNAGVLDSKKALVETNGDFEAAAEILRKKGFERAEKKASRAANEGLIGHYVHMGSKVASLVELNCETDFVARTDEFQQLARDMAMHVTAANPLYLSREDVPADVVAKEKELFAEQMVDSGKPADVLAKIIEGKLDKWYTEVCLLEQPYIRDPDVTIEQLLRNNVASLGENIRIRRFARLEIGG
jgi:elongation factor Ts